MVLRSPRPCRVGSTPDPATRALLLCGAVAGPLFVTTFLVDGAARPDYDPLRHPVSSLALGPRRRVQIANFFAAGTLYLAGAVGLGRAGERPLRSPLGPALIGAVAVGLLGSGAFPTDPISGYPPGTPDVPARGTTGGALHDAFGVGVFLGLPVAALVYARRFLRIGRPGWAAYSAGTATAMLATFGVAGAGFSQSPSVVRVAGLAQRTSITIGFAWLTALCLRALRRPR